MAALLSAWMSIRVWIHERQLLAIWPLVCAWVVGMGLSAPSWMMLQEYVGSTVRGQAATSLQWGLVVPFRALWGLVFSHYNTVWPIFGKYQMHRSLELTGTLVPCVILLTGLTTSGRRAFRGAGWELSLCCASLLLSMLPSAGVFRWSFRWLPLFSLCLSLTAVQVLANLRLLARSADDRKTTPNLGLRAVCLLIPVGILSVLNDLESWQATALIAVAAVAIGSVWLMVERSFTPRSTPVRWAPVGAALAIAMLAYTTSTNSLAVPSWPIDRSSEQPPLRTDTRYLSAFAADDIFSPNHATTTRPRNAGVDLAPGNYGMYSGVETINGYSPIHPEGLTRLFGFRDQGYLKPDLYDPAITDREATIAEFLVRETTDDGLLAAAGVDGLILANRFQHLEPDLEANGWRADAATLRGRIYYRIEASRTASDAFCASQATLTGDFETALSQLTGRKHSAASLLLTSAATDSTTRETFASAEIRMRENRRNSVNLDVTASGDEDNVLVVLQRPWFPGYRAFWNGASVPVERFNLMMPAVRVPTDSGILTFEYRPRSLTGGTSVAGTTLFAILAVCACSIRRAHRPHPPVTATQSDRMENVCTDDSSVTLTVKLDDVKDVLT